MARTACSQPGSGKDQDAVGCGVRREHNGAEREEERQKLGDEERGPVGATPLTTVCPARFCFVPGSTERFTCVHSVLAMVLMSHAVALGPTLQMSN